MKREIIIQLVILAGFAVLSSCGLGDTPAIKEGPPAEVHPIAITEVKTILPQAGNVALLESSCVPCHSLRYIEMQPELSLEAWEKIVDKMIHTYGAPVRDSATRRGIIDYLYAIKGTK